MLSLPLEHYFQCSFTFGTVSTLHDWWKSNTSVIGEPKGNWRWNSDSRDVTLQALLPFLAKVPRRACLHAKIILFRFIAQRLERPIVIKAVH